MKVLYCAVACLLFFFADIGLAYAATSATTAVSQVISSGSLNISAPSTTTLAGATVSTSNQIVNGTISAVNVYDQRGTAVGWTSSMTSEHLTFTANPKAASANTSPVITLNSGSRYNGTCGLTYPHTSYTVTMSLGGAVGTAKYSVTGGCTGESNQTDVITAASNNSVGSRGVTINFPAGTYALNDNWLIPLDLYPYTSITVTPQAATAALSGSDLTGVTAASAGALSGSGATSNSKTVLTASSGNGMGSYNQDISLEQTLHNNQYAGDYKATITLTVV